MDGGFTYRGPDGRAVRSAAELARFRALAIPPAWTEVWICSDELGHLQAIGRDAAGRRQYRYHPDFRARRDKGKFARLVRFGDVLPRIRRRVRADLALRGLPRDKVLAAVVSLLEATKFRVGGTAYARLNRSFGLSTLRTRHAAVRGSTVRFRFRGKGGRTEDRELVDRRLAAVVRRCQDLPGQALFQYLGDDGEVHGISSEDVNAYLREAAGTTEVSAKDYRTWSATLLAHVVLREAATEAAAAAQATERETGIEPPKRVIDQVVRHVAEELGDTVAVTRGSYVHPEVLAGPLEDLPPRRRRSGAAIQPTRKDELELLRVLRKRERTAARAARRGAA